VKQAQRAEPPRQILSAISARHAGVLADREEDAAAGAMQLFGDLRTRSAGADHQHRARWKLAGVSVAAGVDLKYLVFAQQIRHQGALIRAGRDHDVFGLDWPVRSLRDEAGAAFAAREPRHLDAAADWWGDKLRKGIDEFDDVA
jgi:predicted TIM-barrel fold metal-dependent hydrolase